ncbi:MAG: Asp-tRNA(Asn)/Glu-tRNA(Gln) amidotransferase subunit GatB [Myxococcales bacterium]|nr:MAG: Asp-tRNA(Asn)/Glu-tRNA(Gln) amidotransferase subunit GatB [Myxococcales bacterium]
MTWKPVIGLEVHVRLKAQSKLFCACANDYGRPPNTAACPVCLGLPGALPTANAQAIALAVRAALALNADVQPTSRFARKNYFYPDLPKGYQITQYDQPLALGGWLDIPGAARRIPLTRLHIEEDAGKTAHAPARSVSLVDYNRCGAPLAEIVTEPELTSPAEAAAFLKALRRLLVWIDVTDGDMEEGALRCDVNVSLRDDAGRAGERVEIKNLNSFRFVEQSLEYEIARQQTILEHGGAIERETRHFDPLRRATLPMRGKEDSPDYRYFPEPDLPPLALPSALVAEQARLLPEFPDARAARLAQAHGLTAAQTAFLMSDRATADYFEAAVTHGAPPVLAANWLAGEAAAELNRRHATIVQLSVAPLSFAELLRLLNLGRITTPAAKALFAEMAATGKPPESLLAENPAYLRRDDAETLEKIIDDVIARHPALVEKYRSGKTAVLDALVGLAMKAAGGAADPKQLRDRLIAKLAGDS